VRKSRIKTSKTSLSIVERAYRGSLEEQYGHIVWLTKIMHAMGAPTSILLKGDTVLYAKRSQPRLSLQLGTIKVDTLSHYESTIEELLRNDVPVYVWRDDLTRLGLATGDLVAGVRPIGHPELVGLVRQLDCVWYW